MAEETVIQGTQTTEGEQKTFTQEEVNNIVAERLGRDRQKFADYDELKQKAAEFDKLQEANKTELQKATERANSLEKELAGIKKANEIRDIRSKVSKETGVPLELLTADTEEECKKQADALNAFATSKGGHYVPDGGEANGSLKRSTSEQFAEAVKNIL